MPIDPKKLTGEFCYDREDPTINGWITEVRELPDGDHMLTIVPKGRVEATMTRLSRVSIETWVRKSQQKKPTSS